MANPWAVRRDIRDNIIEDSFLPEIFSLKESFSSQWLSDFLTLLSSQDAALTSFNNSLIAGESDTLVYDITSFSSASWNIDWLEWGYNRDGLETNSFQSADRYRMRT